MDTLFIFLLGLGWLAALFLPAAIVAAVLMHWWGDKFVSWFLGDE